METQKSLSLKRLCTSLAASPQSSLKSIGLRFWLFLNTFSRDPASCLGVAEKCTDYVQGQSKSILILGCARLFPRLSAPRDCFHHQCTFAVDDTHGKTTSLRCCSETTHHSGLPPPTILLWQRGKFIRMRINIRSCSSCGSAGVCCLLQPFGQFCLSFAPAAMQCTSL